MNTLGQLFKVSTFGESHGPAIGVMIDGCPAGLEFDKDFIQSELDKRRPGQTDITTSRNELDIFDVISGVFENKTTGAPITILIKNKNARPEDYKELRSVYRPSHADFTYHKKYGHRDHRGGGRSSARVTAGWVAAGALAKLYLKLAGVQIHAYVKRVHTIELQTPYTAINLNEIEKNPVRCPDKETAIRMEEIILQAKKEGDSLGGVVACLIQNVPIGLGEPLFDKLNARLAHAIMSINATKGIQFGGGFDITRFKGSEINDAFIVKADGSTGLQTNHSGGIQGGISNGEPIYFETAFKPTASISKSQKTVDTYGKEAELQTTGRHDPCVLPRAVPVVEAMAALVIADFMMLQKAYSL